MKKTLTGLLPIFMFIVTAFVSIAQLNQGRPRPVLTHGQGEMAGEVTENSVILQSRLTWGDILVDEEPGWPDGDLPGHPGIACFEISTSQDFTNSFMTEWVDAVPEYDFIIKIKVDSLKRNTRYYYRLIYGADRESVKKGRICTFKTLSGRSGDEKVSFAVVTGMNHYFFYYSDYDPRAAHRWVDRHIGYPALKSILQLKPDFFIGTGDNIYYDHPGRETSAKTQTELRRKWHEQFVQQRFIDLFAQVPTYWEKDDHDHRYDDCDPYGNREPSNELGIATFLEQVPIVDPKDENPITYRTHRLSKHLQIWLVEGRDYRSPNKSPDGPEKTIWGAEQMSWLKQTLLESDATFKILISPTPMIGPDRASKRDNHTNPRGFRYEGREFFKWLDENNFLNRNFYIVCGDRHWQYHSIDPAGFEEFSCGALVDANAIKGTFPGDPGSTDLEAKIIQIFHPKESSGGFLLVTVSPGENGKAPAAEFTFYDEKGNMLYSAVKRAN